MSWLSGKKLLKFPLLYVKKPLSPELGTRLTIALLLEGALVIVIPYDTWAVQQRIIPATIRNGWRVEHTVFTNSSEDPRYFY